MLLPRMLGCWAWAHVAAVIWYLPWRGLARYLTQGTDWFALLEEGGGTKRRKVIWTALNKLASKRGAAAGEQVIERFRKKGGADV